MERPDMGRLLARLLRAGRRLQADGTRIWIDGRARPEDRETVDRLTREGHPELSKKR